MPLSLSDAARGCGSVGALGAEHGTEGAGQDGEVLEHRPVVEPDRLAEGEVGAAGDLPEAAWASTGRSVGYPDERRA